MADVRVFISYSRVDTGFAERLKSDLRAAGVQVWIDHESLEPGAPDWQAAIRRGIDAAHAVVYIASPEAAQSLNVRAEVLIATEQKRTIIPLWVRGEQWSECAPFQLLDASHVDARGADYADGLLALRRALGLPDATEATRQSAPAAKQPAEAAANQTLRLTFELGIPFDIAPGARSNPATHSVAWSPDGKVLAVAFDEGVIRLYDTSSGHLLKTLAGHAKQVNSVVWAPNGTRLASASDDKTVRIWDPASGAALHTLTDHIREVTDVAWSPDGSLLVSVPKVVWIGKLDTSLRVWDPYSGRLREAHDIHPDFHSKVGFSPDGSWLATNCLGATSLSNTGASPHIRVADVRGYMFSWAPDSMRFVEVKEGGRNEEICSFVRVYELAADSYPLQTKVYASDATCIAWSPANSCIAMAGSRGFITLLNSVTLASFAAFPSKAVKWFYSIAWSPDGRRFAAGGIKGLEIWSVEPVDEEADERPG